MKVLLINPNSKLINSHSIYRQFFPPIVPLGLAYIAAILEANGINVDVLDLFADRMSEKQILKIIKNKAPNIIGFSVLTPVVNETKYLIRRIRCLNNNAKIILGNTHASYFSHQFLEEGLADIVVRGEGEIPVFRICETLKKNGNLSEIKGISYRMNGNIFHNRGEEIVEDLDDLPFPVFHLFNLDRYRDFPLLFINNARFLPISASRGCPYQCYYCSQNMITKKVRYRNVKRVVDEMEYMHKTFEVRYFCFTDANFPFSESQGTEFCNEIMKRGLNRKVRWCTETRVDKINKKLLREMKKAGLYLIMFGIEVGNQEILTKMNKKTSLQEVKRAIGYVKENGILSLGLFMLGLPGETKETCEETIHFAKEVDCDMVKFNIAIPYPGSKFFKDFYRNNRESFREPERFNPWYDWLAKEQKPIYVPEGMTAHDLIGLQRRAMFKFYLRPKKIIGFFKKVSIHKLLLGAYILTSRYFFYLIYKIFDKRARQ